MTGSCQALTGPVSLAGASGSSIGLKFIFLPAAVSFVEAIPVNPIHEDNPYLLSAHHQQEIQAERDQKLDAAKEQRKNRRQRAA